MSEATTTLSAAEQKARADYPTPYIGYSDCLAICTAAGLSEHLGREWLKCGAVGFRQFGSNPRAKKFYRRDDLLKLVFGD